MSEGASTAKADHIPFNDSRIQWRDATSGKGAPIKIGVLKRDDSDVEVKKRSVGNEPTITHDEAVSWPVGDNTWKTPSQSVIDKFDISQYYLTTNSGWYDYVLHIQNTQDWDYTFYDQTGDDYGLNCFATGDHYVSYNSKQPEIVKIHATS